MKKNRHRIGIFLIAMVCSCPRVREQPIRVPEAPPRTLELLAEGMGDERLPPATQPVRRDHCGIPLALSPIGLMHPEGIGRMQAKLVDEGFLAARTFRPGTLDAPTVAALAGLQAREDLPKVGLPTYATIRALDIELDAVFRAGEQPCKEEQ